MSYTPSLHNKIPALKIFARGWVAQESICYTINAKIFQGLGPKRQESCNGDRVYASGMHRGTHQVITLSVKPGEGDFGARPSFCTID